MTTPSATPSPRWADRLELGEGARWVDGRLVLVDILSGRLLADGADGGGAGGAGSAGDDALDVIADLPVALGAVAPVEGAPGVWIAAAGTGVCVLTNTGDVEWISHVEHEAATPMRVNDAVADAHGRLWFGTMAYDNTDGAGSLYRMERDGSVTRVLSGITIPNGPAFSEDGTTMYLADSARGSVHRYAVDAETGELGEPSLFVDFAAAAGLEGGPDGMTVDVEGGVWIANWGGAAARRYLPDGTPDLVVELPASQPASVCLGGADGRVLYITTATYGLNPPTPDDGAVLTVRVDVPGFAAAPFRPSGGGRVAEAVNRVRRDGATR
jgi:sugar lactone lactonase YvrE